LAEFTRNFLFYVTNCIASEGEEEEEEEEEVPFFDLIKLHGPTNSASVQVT